MSAAEGPIRARSADARLRILVAGATGYIGLHVVRELLERGHDVVSLVRASSEASAKAHPMLAGSEIRSAKITDPGFVQRGSGVGPVPIDAVVSCIASRGGGIKDSWRVEFEANRNLLSVARRAGASRFVLLSAICVQKPELAFQHGKLAFECELRQSELAWSIVRPTAFFKSIAGQVPRVKAGKPYLLLGPGDGPACKPISEADVAAYIADCLHDPMRQRRILPIGGPGPASTARERGEMLFELAGRRPRFRRVPMAIFDIAERVFTNAARLFPRLEDKAEFARIGRYYATQSMLVLNPDTAEYDADATPEYGSQTLPAFYRRALDQGLDGQELGDHAVF